MLKYFFSSPIKLVTVNCYVTCLEINKYLHQMLRSTGHNSNLFLLMGKKEEFLQVLFM